MKSVLLIALILTASYCQYRQKAAPHFVDTKTILTEIDQDHFGNTMISAIALNMATQSPMEEITLLIEEIIQEVQKDQGAADEKNRTDQAICDETIGGFEQQIIEQTETISSLENAIKDNKEILEQAKIDLDQANRDYDETIQSIESGTNQRKEEHEKWAEEDYQQQIDIATLEEGVKLINHMIHGVAFSQIQARYDKVMEKLRSPESKHSTLFKPLITSLTQLATKLNYENVMKIIELLTNIRQAIIEEQQIAQQGEQRAQADWEVLLSHLEQQKQSLTEKRSRLNALIDNTNALLAQLSTSLENHRVELENLQESLSSQTAWCNVESVTYLTETGQRERELEILQKLLDHLNERYTAVNDYISSRQ